MSAKHWMVACLFGLAGAGNAMATNMDSRDITANGRSATDAPSRSGGGGDLLDLGRDHSTNRHDADAGCTDAGDRAGGAAGGSEHGGQISTPTSARPAKLGWQSLLPGSIQ